MGLLNTFKWIASAVLVGGLLSTPLAMAEESLAEQANRGMMRSMNFGNSLEAPQMGFSALPIRKSYFKLLKDAGFTGVRFPIRWTNQTWEEAPYTVYPDFFERLDGYIKLARKQKLTVVINQHHFEDLYAQPALMQPRFLAIWKQIAEHYQHAPNDLVFEILNEPHGNLDADTWNTMLVAALKVIRASNPTRPVIIGTAEWGGMGALSKLEIPANDPNLILTVHYYEPFKFTHQGTAWVTGANDWLGTPFNDTPEERARIAADFQRIRDFATAHGIRAVNIGEFGAYAAANMADRARWTRAIRETAESLGFSWSYWEFSSDFGAYDRGTNQWRKPLLEALTGH